MNARKRGPATAHPESTHQADAGLRAENFVAVTGLPSQGRAIWARALEAEHERVTSWSQPEFWAHLQRLRSAMESGGWDLEAGDTSRTALAVERDMAGLAATASGSLDLPEKKRNVCATAVVPLAADLLDAREDLRVLVMYESPWEAFRSAATLHQVRDGEAAIAWMDYWLDYHDAALAACAAHPSKILLVNANRLASRAVALLQTLRANAVPVPDGAFRNVDALAPPAEPAGLLARYMDESGPQYWDMYEALESSALLLGREPEFRATGPDIGTGGLPPALTVWAEAFAAREARLENALLLQQVDHLQQELEHYMRSNKALSDSLARSGKVADQARRAISRLALAQEEREKR